MSEAELLAQIQLACSRGDTRLFRFNAGIAWAGRIAERTPRELVLLDYHPVKLGPEGMADLVGAHSVEVTQAMVGSKVAVFCGVEGKAGRRQPTDAQLAFIHMVRSLGGRAGIARSVEDSQRILMDGRAP